MSVFAAIILGLAMGVAFGLLLEKARVFEPAVILGQFQLRSFLMLRVFLAGVAAGLVVLAIMTGFGWARLSPKALLPMADIAGGLVLGVGIALAGACPGTVLAQIGAGYKDAWFTLAGGILGAVAFTYAEPALRPVLDMAGQGRLTLDVVTGVPFWMLALGFAAVLVAALVGLERWRPWRGEIGETADGLMTPAQAEAPAQALPAA
jgi:uncharacterized protein